MSSRWRWVWLVVVLVGAVLALRTLFGFPWRDMLDALTGANLALLSVAAVINFASPLFKGSEFVIPPSRVKDAEAFRIRTNREAGK